MGRFDNKVAVITGGAQGIGATYARELAADGASVVIADIGDGAPLAAEIQAAGGKAIAVSADVTDNGSLAAMVAKAEEAFGPIEILVNNAAIFGQIQPKSFSEISEDEWDGLMRVNVRGAFQAVKAVVDSMRRNGRGKIINMGSGTILRGAPMMLHYVTSKGALLVMNKCLARELAADNIFVNCILAGFTNSESVLANDAFSAFRAPTLAARAIQRDMVPGDLVGTLKFLASEESDFLTGQAINVDGGAMMP